MSIRRDYKVTTYRRGTGWAWAVLEVYGGEAVRVGHERTQRAARRAASQAANDRVKERCQHESN